MKTRLDKLMAERALAPSREKAAALIMAGCVFIGEKKADKPGQMAAEDAEIIIKGEDHPYVSRGGVKLAHALKEFHINANGKICMDVGASTGGFADCLLQKGAARVYAIDVGYGQLAWKIANNRRAIVIERTNIRKLAREQIPEEIELAVIDVSFISLALVLSAVQPFLKRGADIVALVKPQFEVGRKLVGKGGIVRDESLHKLAIEKIRNAGLKLGWKMNGVAESPILGAKGNKEFLMWFAEK